MGKKVTTADFIKRAVLKHGDAYGYSLVNYVGAKNHVDIICKKHGVFQQSPSNHLHGFGCMKCGRERTLAVTTGSLEDFILKAKAVHGDVYNYEYVIYSTAFNPIVLECVEHGKWGVSPNNHLRGRGCPVCADNLRGWTYGRWEKQGNRSKRFVAFQLYFIRCWNDEEEFFKVGKTFNSIKARFSGKIVMPYNYETISVIQGTAREISEWENMIHKSLSNYKYHPNISFAGETECYKK